MEYKFRYLIYFLHIVFNINIVAILFKIYSALPLVIITILAILFPRELNRKTLIVGVPGFDDSEENDETITNAEELTSIPSTTAMHINDETNEKNFDRPPLEKLTLKEQILSVEFIVFNIYFSIATMYATAFLGTAVERLQHIEPNRPDKVYSLFLLIN